MMTETKKKFSPMPGASAMGYFAHSPIRIVAAPDTTHVASSTAPKSSPVGFPVKSVDSTAGCTKMMYAIVRNVVMPATTSVFVGRVGTYFQPTSLRSFSNSEGLARAAVA